MELTAIILSSIELVLLFLTALIALFEFNKNKKISKAKFVSDLYLELIKNKELLAEFEKYDYGMTYEIDERKTDRLLMFLENILFLKLENVIQDDDAKRFEYFIERVVLNNETINYFQDLDLLCKEGGIKFPYPLLYKYQKDHIDKV